MESGGEERGQWRTRLAKLSLFPLCFLENHRAQGIFHITERELEMSSSS